MISWLLQLLLCLWVSVEMQPENCCICECLCCRFMQENKLPKSFARTERCNKLTTFLTTERETKGGGGSKSKLKPSSLLCCFVGPGGTSQSSAGSVSQHSGSSGARAQTFRHNYCITQQSSSTDPFLHHSTMFLLSPP